MAHPEQLEFFSALKANLPGHFKQAKVLEVGALDINGSVRKLFTDCDYTGVDIAEGPGIDLACPGQLLAFPSGRLSSRLGPDDRTGAVRISLGEKPSYR